jgi:hypothetical protein
MSRAAPQAARRVHLLASCPLHGTRLGPFTAGPEYEGAVSGSMWRESLSMTRIRSLQAAKCCL